MFEQITPILLTLNEAPNLGRTLERLYWARDIVVVDSFSEDATVSIAWSFGQVRVFQRKFDGMANQWNFAMRETGIKTEWVLALDADYVLTEGFVEELRELRPDSDTAGYRCAFTYCVRGRPLRASLYPPVVVLFRRASASYAQDGHTQRVVVRGRVGTLRSKVRHDDRKPLMCWIVAQHGYMALEAEKLSRTGWANLGWPDRLRKLVMIAPQVAFLHCLLIKGGLWDGWPGLYYALQRMFAETLLSLRLLERHLRLESPDQFHS